MPNTPRNTTQTSDSSAQQHGRTIPDTDSMENDDRGTRSYRKQSQGRGNSGAQTTAAEPDDKPVEIGDPVPEDQRTVRAGGETGEDEDLPDEGGIEGRH